MSGQQNGRLGIFRPPGLGVNINNKTITREWLKPVRVLKDTQRSTATKQMLNKENPTHILVEYFVAFSLSFASSLP